MPAHLHKNARTTPAIRSPDAEPRCAILGILDDGWPGLSDAARQRLGQAGLVIGARRTLDLVAPRLSAATECRALDGALPEVPDWIRGAWAAGRSVVLLATGDPLCHGIAAWLVGRLDRPERLEILPAPSTPQLACARLRRPWSDARILSCHGADSGEWREGAGPDHALYPLLRALDVHPRLIVFTSPANDPARLARALLIAGYGETARLAVAARLARPDEQLFPDLTPEEAAALNFPAPNLALIECRAPATPDPIIGLPDDRYAQRRPRDGLITRLEVRAATLAHLALHSDSRVWDIGAGSGSVGLEAARLAWRGHVWAIEKNPADAANARANARRLRATNYTLVEGRAPDGLETWPDPDAVFVGGSGGALEVIIDVALRRLRPGGRLVMNFATLENLATATRWLSAAGVSWEVNQIQVARSQLIGGLHRLAAHNPVWILSVSPLPEIVRQRALPAAGVP